MMRIAIRADGGPGIGYGHLVRTGAIAETFLSEGHEVTYATKTPIAAATVSPEGAGIRRLEDTGGAGTTFFNRLNPDLVLTDSYEATVEYQRAVTASVDKHAVVMDDARFPLCADYLVNGNVYAPDLEYEWLGTEPEWLIGIRYLPLRSAIRQRREGPLPLRDTPKRALVTMGGSDPEGTTPAAVRAFDGLGLEVTVVVGPGFSNRDNIEIAVSETDAVCGLRCNPRDLPELMAGADLAVSASGSTVYELLALGTPTIAVPVADNQELIARALDGRGVLEGLPLGQLDELPGRIADLVGDGARRRRYHDRGMDLVDCQGPSRIFRELVDKTT